MIYIVCFILCGLYCALFFSINFQSVQTFGGTGSANKHQGCFFYGGPNQRKRLFDAPQVPSFDALVKNRVIGEKRFFLNNSNTKYIQIGIVPATKFLNPEAPGFYMEAYLCGDKSAPLPLGGAKGLATLFNTIRDIPEFSRIPRCTSYDLQPGENILITTTTFSRDVSFYFFLNVF